MNDDICPARFRRIRCVKRPHEVGHHVAFHEGTVIWWTTFPPAENIKHAPSVPDATPTPAERKAPPRAEATPKQIALLGPLGVPFTGNACGECGSMNVIPSGTCATCQDCGATTGCG